ncbi:DUF2726 domain-containing protein [Massilia terrae]|uniref:DUF2726 domain-containing protein n=1 Tax=Massilia terrae TaxID=1811224 RepID=A0ABT2D2I5_9BURK|nr:DUF2726 domain-containing protein [Massilia terrae]MCS0659991.1 DUF2726 domain-containing protein [Massilia terrae]
MNKQILIPLIIIFVAVIISALLSSKKSGRREGKYRARKLLTDNEMEFFGRIIHALPEYYVFPQVAMSALLEPASREKKQASSDHLRIAQQRVDYLICDERCNIVAVLELDDRTHSRAKDEVRDSRLEQAGIRTIRFQSRNKPTVEAIRAAVMLPSPEGASSIQHKQLTSTV